MILVIKKLEYIEAEEVKKADKHRSVESANRK